MCCCAIAPWDSNSRLFSTRKAANYAHYLCVRSRALLHIDSTAAPPSRLQKRIQLHGHYGINQLNCCRLLYYHPHRGCFCRGSCQSFMRGLTLHKKPRVHKRTSDVRAIRTRVPCQHTSIIKRITGSSAYLLMAKWPSRNPGSPKF